MFKAHLPKDGKPVDLGLEKNMIPHEILQKVFEYTRTRKIAVTRATVSNLLLAADFFQMDLLKGEIADQIRNSRHLIVDHQNCLRLWLMSQNSECLRKPLETIIAADFEFIMYESSFLMLDVDAVATITAWDELNVKTEETVFHAIKMWIDFAYSDRQQHFMRLLGCVRFDLQVDENFLTTEILSCCTCIAAEDYVTQYKALRKQPDLVVGINTQPRAIAILSDSESETDGDDSWEEEDDDVMGEYTDYDGEDANSGSYSDPDWGPPDDYDREGFLNRLFGGRGFYY